METSPPKFKYIIGCDHAGFDMKEVIKNYLLCKNIDVEDTGVYTADRCDYPDLAVKLSVEVVKSKNNRGILVCGSGIGISIAANKIKGIRCGLVHDNYSVKNALEKEYCNVIALGGRVIGNKLALSIVDVFLSQGEFVEDEAFKEKMKIIATFEEKYL